ncbi:hypothetical protein BDF19DRAFT_55259 [Syncephalis fuscata]|nr:hypothetical protein BDF19DRAFT_55259 [Syncephalis fuscata]
MMGRFKKRTCQLPTSEHAQAALRSVNPWYALRGNRDAPELWLIWHNIFNKKNGHNKEELTWKKLTMPSAPLLFCKKVSFSIFYGTRRFVVGNVFIYTYSDVKLIDIGEPVTNVAEMEAQYIKENKSKVSNALDEHSTGSSATTPSTKREFKKRRALLLWPVAGNSPPNIIYLNSKLRDRKRIDILNLSTSYHDWVLLNTSYRKNSYYKYYLFDLDGNQWIEGPEYDNYLSPACIQFASYSQCQFIIWTMISNSKKSTTDSTTTDTPNLHAVDNGNQATRIQWEVFDAQKGQSQCQKILSDQITIPYCPDGVIGALTYTEKMCLIIIFDKENHLKRFVGGKFSATLSLFVLGKFSLNASA